ncbi:hypothetical protein G7067_09515 [Leucobacter insecticola]|uniref:Fibronectin type-III domain-containing protein n=1 Tax=Leucobacter insecticola TaxID=2714934 RepID=A0A6G8FJP7_9MICO|nr:fibronectin type III domain-containing protein [Leucobacter insecticola]QIM16595.1 hypothetical protein G7067_09515 [Leucobacter insecticola]
MKTALARAIAAIGVIAIGFATFTPAGAQAAPIDGVTAPGRATGSGKWGYVGQFGSLNKTAQPSLGDFIFPYAIDVNENEIVVTDSGLASWESGNKALGHSVQTFALTADPGAAGHGNYLGGGQYDIINTKSGVIDPHSILSPTAIDYYAIGTPRGPRGAAFGANGEVYALSYESGTPTASSVQMREYSSSTLADITNIWGPYDYRQTGALPGPVAVDTDAVGNVYATTNTGVVVYGSDGTFLSSVGFYFDQDGQNQGTRVNWPTRAVDVPREYGKPDYLGESLGLSVTEENGQIVVYLGDAGGYYQPDYKIHFPGGSSTAQYLKPASIKKYVLTTSGGIVDARWNPAGWKWTLDTSFGDNGAIQFPGSTLIDLFGSPRFTAQGVFGLEADPGSGTLYYSLNGVSGVKLGAVDLTTGQTAVSAPAPVNTPSAQQDSAMNFVRGIAVDDRGLVYATTQQSTTPSTTRAIVQIWGKTPTSIEGTAEAVAEPRSATLTWEESTVGYQQPDLLDYVVKYRKVGDTVWSAAAVPGGTTTSTELSRTITGLTPETDYEATITPFNEAGSGDPASVTWTTPAVDPAISVTKTGNGVSAGTAADALNVASGARVTFEYTISNGGNVAVTDVVLNDSVLGSVDLPTDFDGTLEPGESVTVSADGNIPAGSYSNTATATALAEGSDITATAVWHGFGVTSGLTLVKQGNGKTARSADKAVQVAADSPVTFSYSVTNTGNTAVTGLSLTDDVLGTVTRVTAPEGFDGTLAPGAAVTFEAIGDVPLGAYQNTAVASGTVTGTGTAVTVKDQWFGFGVAAGVAPDPDSPGLNKPGTDGGSKSPTLSATGGDGLAPLGLAAVLLSACGGVLLLLRRRAGTRIR